MYWNSITGFDLNKYLKLIVYVCLRWKKFRLKIGCISFDFLSLFGSPPPIVTVNLVRTTDISLTTVTSSCSCWDLGQLVHGTVHWIFSRDAWLIVLVLWWSPFRWFSFRSAHDHDRLVPICLSVPPGMRISMRGFRVLVDISRTSPANGERTILANVYLMEWMVCAATFVWRDVQKKKKLYSGSS